MGAATAGGAYQGEGENFKRDDPMELKGKTLTVGVTGKRDENRGTDSYSEIKAPTKVGSRTSVPYSKVLPGYKRAAESAMNKNKVPAKHKKRVKDYFDSLSGGK